MNYSRVVLAAVVGFLMGSFMATPAQAADVHKQKAVYACAYNGTKGVDEILNGVVKLKSSALRTQGWTGKVGRWLPGTTDRLYVIGRAVAPRPSAESCPQPIGAEPVQPAGESDFSASCTMLFVDYPLNQAPANAPFEYLVDGVSLGENFVGYAFPGQGLHTLTLRVAGQQVDSDEVRILACQGAFSGVSDFSISSTMLFVEAPMNQTPPEANYEYFVDGVSLGVNFEGYAYPGAGKHTLVLKVGPEVVDSDTFTLFG